MGLSQGGPLLGLTCGYRTKLCSWPGPGPCRGASQHSELISDACGDFSSVSRTAGASAGGRKYPLFHERKKDQEALPKDTFFHSMNTITYYLL